METNTANPTTVQTNPSNNINPVDQGKVPAADMAVIPSQERDAKDIKTGNDVTAPHAGASVGTDNQAQSPAGTTGQAEVLATDNKEQLHRRVQQREADLNKALDSLDANSTNSERRNALNTELQVVRNATAGGWEHVGEQEASLLSQWLTATESLVLPAQPAASADKSAPPAADQAYAASMNMPAAKTDAQPTATTPQI